VAGIDNEPIDGTAAQHTGAKHTGAKHGDKSRARAPAPTALGNPRYHQSVQRHSTEFERRAGA
jgi:hypothetical protein